MLNSGNRPLIWISWEKKLLSKQHTVKNDLQRYMQRVPSKFLGTLHSVILFEIKTYIVIMITGSVYIFVHTHLWVVPTGCIANRTEQSLAVPANKNCLI